MNVENVMTRAPKTCSPGETVQRAVQLMWDHDFGCVPIVDGNGRLAGIVTDRDACMAGLMLGRPLHEIPIEQAMSRQVFTLAPHDPVKNAIELFLEHNVRRVPVVDGRGQVVGILSIADLVCASAENRIGKHTKPEAVLSAVHAVSKPRSKKVEGSKDLKAEAPAQAGSSDTIVPQARGAKMSDTPASTKAMAPRQPTSNGKSGKRR
jgi:CBS domain-containing protein